MEYGYDDDDEELVGIPWMVLTFFLKKKDGKKSKVLFKSMYF